MDRLKKEQRSRNMSAIRAKDTKPEKRVRSALHKSGFRFALHRNDLPGKPDLVLPRYKTVIFVHGCFWHGHDCAKGKRPSTNVEFWQEKLSSNAERDRKNEAALQAAGWDLFIIWECALDERISEVISCLGKRRSQMAAVEAT